MYLFLWLLLFVKCFIKCNYYKIWKKKTIYPIFCFEFKSLPFPSSIRIITLIKNNDPLTQWYNFYSRQFMQLIKFHYLFLSTFIIYTDIEIVINNIIIVDTFVFNSYVTFLYKSMYGLQKVYNNRNSLDLSIKTN